MPIRDFTRQMYITTPNRAELHTTSSRSPVQLRRHGDSLLMMFALMFTPQQRYIRTREAAELRLGILLAAARALL